MIVQEHDFEPVRGLPERLPEGEEILWQGAPSARLLAQEAFHVRAVAVYFAAMLVWRGVGALSGGAAPGAAAFGVLTVAPIALLALGLLYLLAFLNSRSTVYTITNRRVVMRFGAAVPKAINIPFRLIASAQVRADGAGRGDVALTLTAENRIALLQLWPHVRPFRFAAAQPTFRGLKDASRAASILGSAVGAALPGARLDAAPTPRRTDRAFRPSPAHAS